MIVVTASVCRPMWGRSRLAPSKSATDIDTHGAARVELIPTFLATCQANTRSSLEPQHTHRPHIADRLWNCQLDLAITNSPSIHDHIHILIAGQCRYQLKTYAISSVMSIRAHDICLD